MLKKRLQTLRAKALELADQQKALIAKCEAEGRDMSEAEQLEFDGFGTELDKVADDAAKVEKALSSADRAAGIGASATGSETPAVIKAVTSGAPRVEVMSDLTPMQIVGVAAIAAGKALTHRGRTSYEHLADLGYEGLATKCATARDEVRKTFSLGVSNTADNLIVTPLSSEWIETLRNQSLFMRGGPVNLDMPAGALKISGGATGASVGYTSLGSDLPYGQMTTRQMSMSAKHLRAVTAYDNYSAETSMHAVAAIVGDDLSLQSALAIDSAGLRGDGTGSNPSGVYQLVGAGQRIACTLTSTPTLDEVDAFADAMLLKYRTSNVPRRRPAWLMCNRTFMYLRRLRDGNGNYAYPELRATNPTWIEGIPVLISEQVPSTLGVGTNEAELYLVDFGHVYMGVTRNLVLEASREASYVNASAQLVSAFSRDETVIRAMAAHDFGMRHIKAAVVGTAIKF